MNIITDEMGSTTVANIARKRLSQAQAFGYLGHQILCPVMHLTSGELTKLMFSESYWKFFNTYFWGAKEIMKNKLEEIATIRNSLAHFRPIKNDDVIAIKHNAKHVLAGVEVYLNNLLVQNDVVPTNTEEDWYLAMKTLGNDICSFSFYQSADSQWICIELEYKCPIVASDWYVPEFGNYRVLTIDPPSIMKRNQNLTSSITFATEEVPLIFMPDDLKPDFKKSIHFVFYKQTIEEIADEINDMFSIVLQEIAEETTLIQQDNLARGKEVRAVNLSAYTEEDKSGKHWKIEAGDLLTPMKLDDPPEFWVNQKRRNPSGYIVSAHAYPWMPVTVT